MPEQWIRLRGVSTKVLSFGKSIKDEQFKRKKLILCISGNPGWIGFYTVFLSTLYRLLTDIPVWGIGHAGHDEPIDEQTEKSPNLQNNKGLYSLDGQIKHKVEFIRQYVPADVKIYLIGHSIGSYMALEMLKFDDIHQRIKHIYSLFPTFEYMADSPNGKLYVNYIQPNFKYIYWLSTILTYIPQVIKSFLITIYLWIRSIPFESKDSLIVGMRPNVLSKIIFLANEEMDRVKAPNYDIIEKNQKNLTFIYSSSDKWTPITYFERLVARFPDIDAQITDEFKHAFVLDSSRDVAAQIAGRILAKFGNE